MLRDLNQREIPQPPVAHFVGLGAAQKPDLWLRPARGPIDGLHIALGVGDRRLVDAFHAAALAAGLQDDGAPGVRAHYHANYYGAFVRDSDGHSFEVVCHARPS